MNISKRITQMTQISRVGGRKEEKVVVRELDLDKLGRSILDTKPDSEQKNGTRRSSCEGIGTPT